MKTDWLVQFGRSENHWITVGRFVTRPQACAFFCKNDATTGDNVQIIEVDSRTDRVVDKKSWRIKS
jgi:hypothetical protein